ncbi:MAG: hypothetical protein H0U15_06150 [Geodermatophilaceae bacterium]|nr:hypothetical protein [Geodermatophilaceae bacterium]
MQPVARLGRRASASSAQSGAGAVECGRLRALTPSYVEQQQLEQPWFIVPRLGRAPSFSDDIIVAVLAMDRPA